MIRREAMSHVWGVDGRARKRNLRPDHVPPALRESLDLVSVLRISVDESMPDLS